MLDLAIVGAGFSGCAAARYLCKNNPGIDFAILEARDQVGGRVMSEPGVDSFKELGAEFIHHSSPTILKLCEDLGIPVKKSQQSDPSLNFKGERRYPIQFIELWKKAKHKSMPKNDRLSDYVYWDSPEEHQVFRQWLGIYYGASIDQVSAAFYEADHNGDNYRIEGSYQKLCQAMSKEFLNRIRFRTVVKHIEHNNNEVKLFDVDSHLILKAKTLLMTLPAGVWKGDSLSFDPPIQLEAFERSVGVGHVEKVVCEFEKPLKYSSYVDVSKKFPLLSRHALNHKMASLWTIGIDKDDMEKIARREIADYVEGTPVLKTLSWHHWASDPFTQGSYTFVKPKGMPLLSKRKEGLPSNIGFSGEAWADSFAMGTVQGAIETGEQEVKRLIEAI